jgi:hypothetical protein
MKKFKLLSGISIGKGLNQAAVQKGLFGFGESH